MNQFSEQCNQITLQQMQIIQNYYQNCVFKQKVKVHENDDKKDDENTPNKSVIQNQQEEPQKQINNKFKIIQENELHYNRFSKEIHQQDSQLVFDCQFCPKVFKNNVSLYWHTCQKHELENQ
ncbi:unnamed protein product [Paramecium sonneborni]|uniref:C2H2-type domain-containing protein n=1 Tax=Paramecium sonneborni TaxID=65129 RepID=A0A8S1MXD4_9CILI|nr:unnamed protein product [Paramecium sonneborni]